MSSPESALRHPSGFWWGALLESEPGNQNPVFRSAGRHRGTRRHSSALSHKDRRLTYHRYHRAACRRHIAGRHRLFLSAQSCLMSHIRSHCSSRWMVDGPGFFSLSNAFATRRSQPAQKYMICGTVHRANSAAVRNFEVNHHRTWVPKELPQSCAMRLPE